MPLKIVKDTLKCDFGYWYIVEETIFACFIEICIEVIVCQSAINSIGAKVDCNVGQVTRKKPIHIWTPTCMNELKVPSTAWGNTQSICHFDFTLSLSALNLKASI